MAKRSRCGRSFELLEQYLNENLTPEQTEKITGAPPRRHRPGRGDRQEPREDAVRRGHGAQPVLQRRSEGPRDLPRRGAHAEPRLPGRQRGQLRRQLPHRALRRHAPFSMEDPFNLQLDPKARPAKSSKYLHYESLHYYNYGDRPLRVGQHAVHRQGHMPAPTKAMWLNNSNSVIGNVKWHYDVVVNTLPKIEFIAFADWWWTGSCEYSDIVFACDSWAEFKHPDMTASVHQPVRADVPEDAAQARLRHARRHRDHRGVSKALGKVHERAPVRPTCGSSSTTIRSRRTCSASSTARRRSRATRSRSCSRRPKRASRR
jgi:nitrate reductase alpha subunit